MPEESLEGKIDPGKTAVIACATVIEEMAPILPPQVRREVLDFGLHVNPDELRKSLQQAIDKISEAAENIILGYGMCSKAVIGLKSSSSRLIVPRIDDCIAIFMGSKTMYIKEQQGTPGTYYLTKGWIISGSSPFDEFDKTVQKYGEVKAHRIMDSMLKNYKRIAFIDTGDPAELGKYHEHALRTASKFGLQYQELQGSDVIVRKMIYGPWDEEFVVAEPGQTISFGDFYSLGD
jgi:hypothetical protein